MNSTRQQWKWQKGIIRDSDPEDPKATKLHPEFHHLAGKTVWVQAGKPGPSQAITPDGRFHHLPQVSFLALEGWTPGVKAAMYPGLIELLPEGTTEDVEIVPFAVWSKPDWPGIALCEHSETDEQAFEDGPGLTILPPRKA